MEQVAEAGPSDHDGSPLDHDGPRRAAESRMDGAASHEECRRFVANGAHNRAEIRGDIRRG